MAGIEGEQDVGLKLAELLFDAQIGSEGAAAKLVGTIKAAKAKILFEEIAGKVPGVDANSLSVADLEKEIELEEKAILAKITDARENLGENDVREALLEHAEFLARIGDKARAKAAYEETMENTVGIGQKLDIALSLVRIGLIDLDFKYLTSSIARAKELLEKGGDWERRNRLRVYDGVFLVAKRDLKSSAALFLDALATFSAVELFEYKKFVYYTIITCLVSIDRPTLRDKVANAPEILACILEIPHLSDFLNALVKCDYKTYMATLPAILDQVKADRYMVAHLNYIARELRVVAYTQFLASYQSVTLAAMSSAFGVGVPFLDKELSRFIATGRLNCKIDKVSGVVEATRPDAKNALYQKTIKSGDAVLNRIQKLSRVIDI